MLVIVLLAVLYSDTAAAICDWKDVTLGTENIPFRPPTDVLQIKTIYKKQSHGKRDDVSAWRFVKVRMQDDQGQFADLWLRFVQTFLEPESQYQVGCQDTFQKFPVSQVPFDEETTWQFYITPAAEPRIIIKCNGVQVLDLLMKDSKCPDDKWKNWSRDITKFYFQSTASASKEYCMYSVYDWSDWSDCSSDCIGGTQKRTRKCTGDDGADCDGYASESRSCNSDKVCPDNPAENCDWKVVKLGAMKMIPFRPPTDVLQIKTNYKKPSGEGSRGGRGWKYVRVRMLDEQGRIAGDLSLWFGTSIAPVMYNFGCRGGYYQLYGVPDEQEKTWQFYITAEPRIVLKCNGIEVLDHLMNDRCPDDKWKNWSRDITKFYFQSESELYRSASEEYCKYSVWSAWSDWGDCSSNCVGGTQQRTRNCDNPAASRAASRAAGADCVGKATEILPCNSDKVCPVNGGWSVWSGWSDCSSTCVGGTQQRTRKCDNPSKVGTGADCVGKATETLPCNSDKVCPEDGGWSVWNAWSDCSSTCFGGTQQRTRKCDNPAKVGTGADCVGEATESQNCNEDIVCPGWNQVKRNVKIPYDEPLYLKTGALQSNAAVDVQLYDKWGKGAGGIWLKFGTTVEYYIYYCSEWLTLTKPLPKQQDKTWTITKTAGPGILVTCNTEEVLNLNLSDLNLSDLNLCTNFPDWKKYWKRDSTKVKFHNDDTATDEYCSGNCDI